MPITILHVFWRMDRGGAELRTLDVMRLVDREKYRFVFLATSGQGGTLDEEIRALGGEVIPCKLGRGFGKHFREVLRAVRPDVVHSHLHLTSGYVLRYAKQVPLRIAHLRSMGDGRASSPRRLVQRWLLRRLTLKHAHRILAVSEGALDAQFSGWRGNPKFQVIYNGVPFEPYCEADAAAVRAEFGIPANAPFFIHVGRLDAAKNHEKLISVFGAILRRDPRAHLLLVGRNDGEQYEARRAMIQELQSGLPAPHQVVWAGERPDVARLLVAADAMIFPSSREGLPGAVIESCLAATPVVASDVPGACEIAAQVQAAGLSLVRPLSIAEEDEVWAAAALELAGQKFDVTTVHRALRGRAFDMETCVAKMRAVWDGPQVKCQAVDHPSRTNT